MVAVRFVLIFMLPIIIALLLHYGTFSLNAMAHQEAREWLNLALSADEETKKAAYGELAKGSKFRLHHWLHIISAGSILVVGLVSALVIPINSPPERTVNFMTALLCGFCFAKLFIAYSLIPWTEFGVWVAGALVCALIFTKLRRVHHTRTLVE